MKKLRVLDLFSGIGGFSLGLERSGGFETVAFCEIEDYPRRVLARHWPSVRCYDDVRTLTAGRLAADGIAVDVICGWFPCQDASIAKTDGTGSRGERTGLFAEAVRLASDIGCPIIMENVPELLNRGFGDVLRSLAEIGFVAEWDCIRARDGGACHQRERLFVIAYPSGKRWPGLVEDDSILVAARAAFSQHGHGAFDPWHALVSGQHPLRSGDGISVAMERRRLKATGNAVVPAIAECIGRAIMQAEGMTA
jgi:DNA (cytosine-5)-methyltransferase 1